MLENRDYMREPSFKPRWSLTLTLMVVNVVVYCVQLVADVAFPAAGPGLAPPSDVLFALSFAGLKHGFIWQILTFQFMHGGLLHLGLNCLALYVFGRPMEEALGRRSFLWLYFSSGVAGGLLHVLCAALWPGYFGGAVVGASAGIFGLMAAFATLYPDQMMTMFIIIFPVNLRARTMLAIAMITAALGMGFPRYMGPIFGNVAHAAHFGGALMGVLFVRQILHWQIDWLRVFQRPLRRTPPREYVSVPFAKGFGAPKSRAEEPEDLSTADFLSREVDPILEKISQHGIHSLTERERKILEAARKKMTH